MTSNHTTGYAFALTLPTATDYLLQRWTEETSGATWDSAGGHVTLARLTGSVPPEEVIPMFQQACAELGSIDASFSRALREPYWDKPGLEIVMLAAQEARDIEGVMALRERLLALVLPLGLELYEAGEYLPHITLTTGLPPEEARRLEASASALDLRFRVDEVTYWSGGENVDAETPPDPRWRILERVLLL